MADSACSHTVQNARSFFSIKHQSVAEKMIAV